MITRVGRLRELIIESLYAYADAHDEFYSRIKDMAYDQGGLKVTHESPQKNFDAINDGGIKRIDVGIYLTVGWLKKPSFVRPGMGIIVHVRIPSEYVNDRFIVPDDAYNADDPCADLLHEFPGVTGAEIGLDLDEIPVGWIDNILDPTGKSMIGRKT